MILVTLDGLRIQEMFAGMDAVVSQKEKRSGVYTCRGTIPQKLMSSRLPGSVYDQACYESDDSGADGPTTAIDRSTQPLGTPFYYLLSGENACGESIIGRPSAPPGGIISNALPCPTPP